MVYSLEQAPTAAQGAHLVLYDGTCGLCNGLLQFLLAHDERGVFAFASLQSDVGKEIVERFGGIPNELTSFHVVANYCVNGAQMFSRSRAALLIAGELDWPWKIAVVLRVLPTAILDPVYDVIARRRYCFFGRLEWCLTPRPEIRCRFIDR
jgi:predicted DCC family thiol-disulfide oxidoreductase YuxK